MPWFLPDTGPDARDMVANGHSRPWLPYGLPSSGGDRPKVDKHAK